MSKKLNPKAAAHIKGAQLALVETALVGFVEEVDGKVPDDDTILREGWHLNVEGNDLAAFRKDGKTLNQYFVWRGEHVLALGFVDENPLALSICRVPEAEWSLPIRMYVQKRREQRNET